MLKIYNTLTKTKEEFKPINAGKVGMYTCGPTVYDYIHIGNIRAYLTADVLRRYLEYLGYEVRHIKNITDVGHLTEDDIGQGDTGEDKMAKKALREKKTPQEIAQFYENYFRGIEQEMNILPAHYFPRATAHVPQMIKIIERLLEKGLAYEKNGNVFFDVTKFPAYGKLSGNTLENLKVGARLEEHPDKINAWDFALWLKAQKDHFMKWESPWSLGYPGWHIECSAMSMEYLGDTMDIHTGAEDNIFPHHEAEIAQSEGATGKRFVNYWVHLRHLLVNGEKMSKSKGNFYILDDIKNKGYNPMVLRLLLLSSNRHHQMNFTWEAMEQAKANYERIAGWVRNLEKIATNGSSTPIMGVELPNSSNSPEKIDFTHIYEKRFEEAMDDDLNTPLALAVIYELITETNKLLTENKLSAETVKGILDFWNKVNKVFGLSINPLLIPNEIIDLAEARAKARAEKKYKEADELRKKIEREGYFIEDTKNNHYIIGEK